MMKPRRKPYSELGIRRVPCARCGRPSSQQWSICADGNAYRGVCTECDIALNKLVLKFMRFAPSDIVAKMAAYRAAIGQPTSAAASASEA